MRRPSAGVAVAAAGVLMLAGAAHAQGTPQAGAGGQPEARAELEDPTGKARGQVRLVEHPQGVLIRGELSGLPPGWHAIHVHETGKCEPSFQAAGGHFNPTSVKHGLGEDGMHAGDLPNIWAAGDGTAKFEMVTQQLSLGGRPAVASGGGASTSGAASGGRAAAPSLFDGDGAAIVVHAKADDYRTDPAGDSGDRTACGVIERR